MLFPLLQDNSVTVASAIFGSIIGKEAIVLLQLTDANVAGDSNLYNVVDLCDSAMYEGAMVLASPTQATSSFSMEGDSVCI